MAGTPTTFMTKGLPAPIVVPPNYANKEYPLLQIGGWCKYACYYLERSYGITFWACEAPNGHKCPEPRCGLWQKRKGVRR